jgi:hypothetical protein
MYNNYPYGNIGYLSPQAQYMQYNSQTSGLKGRPVSSIEEVRAAQIDFDGSLFVFPDIANKRIYTKQIKLDGTAEMKVFAQVETTLPIPAYVTREELDSTIEALKQSFNNVKETKVNESKSESSSDNAPLTF